MATELNQRVLCDGSGRFYRIPSELLDEWRVPDEQQAAAAASFRGEQADVAGYVLMTPLPTPVPGVTGVFDNNPFNYQPGGNGQPRPYVPPPSEGTVRG